MPIFLIQAANDYSIGSTRDLTTVRHRLEARWCGRRFTRHWGVNNMEGHLFESRGMQIYAEDVRTFLERYL